MQAVPSHDGTSIAFDRVGDGPALITIGGATATRAAASAAAAQLAQHFTVFSYDRRGRGDSGDAGSYADGEVVDREVEDLAVLIEAAGGSALAFGHSSGAVLALEAARRGLSIPKLAIYEPPFIIDDSRPPLPGDYVAQLRELIANGQREEALEYFMTSAVGIPAEYIDGIKQAPFWADSVAVAHTISYDGEIMGDTMSGDPAALERFASINTPTLVMVGSESPPYQRNAVQALIDLLPDAQLRVMEGQDHGVAPEVLVPALVDFFLNGQIE